MPQRLGPMLIVLLMALTGCGGGSGLGGPSTTATATPQNLYVADAPSLFAPVPASTPAVTVYTLAANAGTPPARTLSGTATGLMPFSVPSGIALDAAGNLYLAVNTIGSASSINVYPPGANGNVGPQATVPQTQSVLGVALALGRMYTLAGNAILGFPVPGSNLAPVTIAVPLPTPFALASDRSGYLYTLNEAGGVFVFAPGASTPVRALAVQIDTGVPVALTVDQSGNLYAGSDGTVQVFPSGASGNASPLRTISGSFTGLSAIHGLAVDALGYLYVADTHLNGVLVFAPAANGNVQPVTTLYGPTTGITAPSAIAVGF